MPPKVFEKNMTQKNPPVLAAPCQKGVEMPPPKACSGQEYTKVTFWPDFSRFGMTALDGKGCS